MKGVLSLAMLISVQAFSQSPPAASRVPPPADELSLALASEWAQAAIDACRANGYNVTATYMNSEFGIKLVMRSDGTSAETVDIARRKAYTVIKTGMSSGEFGASVGFPPGTPVPPAEPGKLRGAAPGNPDQNLIVAAGGLPVKVNGKTVGAVSISGAPGGDKDDACAQAGLAKIAGKLK